MGTPGDSPFRSSISRPGLWGRTALAVFRREAAETLRDRRTLVAAVLLPVLTMPLVVLVMPVLAARQQEALRDRPVRVVLQGGDAGGLAALGSREGTFRLIAVPEPRAALLRGEIEAVLADQQPSGRGPRVVTVWYDESRPASRAAVQRIAGVAARLALRDLESAARRQGVDPAALVQVVIEPRNAASPERMGGALLAAALPFFLAVWLLLGGQYAALDVGVGERERGSLDALLTAPAPRSAVVAGKFLAVLAPAVMAVGLMLAAGVATLRFGSFLLTTTPVEVSLPAGTALELLLVATMLGGFLSACQLWVSLRARSLREAQQGFTALYLAVALPVMLIPLLGELSQPWVAFVPVVNAVVAFRGILVGATPASALAWTAGSLAVLTVPVLCLGTRAMEDPERRIR
ncbi:MAG: ABC transporter permease [Armatimonadetes bacterium]|nr:ABC transporter permease [Armatimonadota bacterium]